MGFVTCASACPLHSLHGVCACGDDAVVLREDSPIVEAGGRQRQRQRGRSGGGASGRSGGRGGRAIGGGHEGLLESVELGDLAGRTAGEKRRRESSAGGG